MPRRRGFRALGHGLREGLGVDAGLVGPLAGPRHRLLPGSFPDDLPPGAGGFDAVTLAVDFEHIPASPGWRR
ncbi:MAG: hypothetical protein ACR2HQ_04290 [Ilumatobacteraceae bacterium]